MHISRIWVLHHLLNDNEIIVILPYIATEVLSGQPSTQARDIYSFGIIMWEILTGEEVFNGYEFNDDLAIKICFGLRLKFTPGTSKCYFELAKQYMNSDPKERHILMR